LLQPTQRSANAGSLDAVTRNLAARLAAKGGSDDDWNLLAQSYEYMGRASDAQAARSHVAGASADQFATMARALDSPASAAVAK
jgi:cytochrome c-type biogenesis protein CcmH/NrfG